MLKWIFATLLVALLSATHALNAEPRVLKDIVYGSAGGEQLKLDVYQPDNDPATSHAVMLLIHGGGWAGGDKSAHAYIGLPLARKGYLAFSANYRLAPKWQYPAGVEDCQAALRWVRAHAADYGGDPSRLAMGGESAGGHLSSLLGLWDWTTTGSTAQGATTPTRVRAVVNVFGPSDLTGFEQIPFCRDLLKNFLGGTETQMPQLYRDLSPMLLLNTDGLVQKPGPAFLHLHGTKDVLVPVDQTRHFHARLQEKGFDSTMIIFEGANHGWAPASEEGKRSWQAICELLNRTLKP
jgi:acetyl esterase/lipase